MSPRKLFASRIWFCTHLQKGRKRQIPAGGKRQAMEKLETKTQNHSRKTIPATFDERIQKLKEVQQGWLQYYHLASIQGKLKDVDGWVRNRLRCCIWKQ